MENIHSEENSSISKPSEPTPATPTTMAYAPRPTNPYILPGSILLAALIVAGSIIYLVQSGGTGGSAKPKPLENPVVAVAATTNEQDAVIGDENAPVLVVEYGDYQCPFCGIYFEEVEPVLKSQYVDTGKIRFVFRHLAFLGPESTEAAAAVECAEDQGKFWEYHDALYRTEVADFNATRKENNGNLNRALFLRLASETGLNVAAFTQCIDSGTHKAAVEDATAAASSLGINSTPTTFVNGKKVVVLDAEGNPVPDRQTGDVQSVGANAQIIVQAIEAALKGSR